MFSVNESEITVHNLEKHLTRNIKNSNVNGFLIPVWRDWDDIITVKPEMVYITSIDPGEIKGPHLHIIRHSYFTCIKGKVVFIVKEDSGNYLEIESSPDDPVLLEIPKNHSSAHINLSDEPSIIMALVNPSWKPDNKDEHNVTYDNYDWDKWKNHKKI